MSQFSGCILRSALMKADYVTATRRRPSQFEGCFEGCFKCVLLHPQNERRVRCILRSLPYPEMHCGYNGKRISEEKKLVYNIFTSTLKGYCKIKLILKKCFYTFKVHLDFIYYAHINKVNIVVFQSLKLFMKLVYIYFLKASRVRKLQPQVY